MISSRKGKSLIVIGGWNTVLKKPSEEIFEFQFKHSKWLWTKMNKRISSPGRQYPLAFHLPLQLSNCCKLHS